MGVGDAYIHFKITYLSNWVKEIIWFGWQLTEHFTFLATVWVFIVLDKSPFCGDCNDNNGWLLYSANLPIKKTQCTSTHHSHKYTHRHKHNLPPPPHTHTRTHIMVHLDLWQRLLKRENFELGFEVREGGEIPQAGRQTIQDSWGNETERMVANRFEIVFRDFQEFFIQWSEGAWSLIHAERSWKVRGKCTVEVKLCCRHWFPCCLHSVSDSEDSDSDDEPLAAKKDEPPSVSGPSSLFLIREGPRAPFYVVLDSTACTFCQSDISKAENVQNLIKITSTQGW